MFFAEEKDGRIIAFDVLSLEPHKVYKIPAGIFHTHTLSKDAKLLIVEEENTCPENSPRIYMNLEEKAALIKAFEGYIYEV